MADDLFGDVVESGVTGALSGAKGGIASAVINGLVGIGTTLISGGLQSNIIKEGEEAARSQYLSEMAQRNKEFAASQKLTRDQMRQNQKQFEAGLALNKEELSLRKNQMAREAFRNQATKLTSILNQNESLKNLYINRLAGLRN